MRLGALYVRLHHQDSTKDSNDGFEADEDSENKDGRIKYKTRKIYLDHEKAGHVLVMLKNFPKILFILI